uniref:Zinc finger and BTB domain containing 22a n=1 Tax=Mastacembelus armatus TaxID=205130 RepID=A0A7N9ASR8_9TELE
VENLKIINFSSKSSQMNRLDCGRIDGRLCDLSIQVQGQVFKAHRCVLAASSPYFHDQVDTVAFESVLSSAYTGQLSIVHDDIVNYVTVASFLQMWHIVDKCTEILKRPRPSADATLGESTAAHPGTSSRQQSPSSTDCLYLEREGRRRERKPDFSRWGRPRTSSAQHLADSQLDALPDYTENDYNSCEEAWITSHAKTGHFAHDGPGHSSRHHGGFPNGETLKQKVRLQQRGAPLSADRLHDKNREMPVSPDFTMASSEVTWPSTSMGHGGPLTPTSSRHLSSSSAAFPPPPSPPTPSSSSSVSLAGTPYTGKVHFCHCGKAYTLKSMRDRHVKMQHLNLRPFGCPVCTKSFKMKHHLTKHLKTHGGLRPYECSLCGKKVIWRDSFLRHQARCERLASSSSANGNNTSTAAADVDDSYTYGFDEGEAFLATGGQVKVEEVDFHGEMEHRMDGLLGSVSGIVDELRTHSQNLDTGNHVFKEEVSESFSGN